MSHLIRTTWFKVQYTGYEVGRTNYQGTEVAQQGLAPGPGALTKYSVRSTQLAVVLTVSMVSADRSVEGKATSFVSSNRNSSRWRSCSANSSSASLGKVGVGSPEDWA